MDTVDHGSAEAGFHPSDRRDDLLIVSEAAKYLGVSAGTLRNWDREGKLKAERNPINRYRLYRRKDLEQLFQARRAALRVGVKFPTPPPEQPRPGQH